MRPEQTLQQEYMQITVILSRLFFMMEMSMYKD